MKSYEIAAGVCPTERQIKWQDTEFYGIVYYGMNTFTGREIGDGFAVPDTFCPENIDTDDWAQTAAAAGMKGLILTAKHYDGFCVWQTETTDYSVKSSGWLGGKGDLVKLTADSARKAGLKFGLYIPVWDRHEKSFRDKNGSFNSFFMKQLNELITRYGKLFAVWLDDRCDEDIPFDFDWKSVYEAIRREQPDCAIVFRGPDGRWVGNSRGVTRSSEWSVVPSAYGYNEDGTVTVSKIRKKQGQMETDIGSRGAIKGETQFVWAPCEVNCPMRPHWFYKKDDDCSQKTKDRLLSLYYRTVGNNANLMLGLAPDRHGKINETDAQILKSTGHDLAVIFGYNIIAADGEITASSELSALYKTDNIKKDDETFWSPNQNDKKPELTVTFKEPQLFDKVIIKEHIRTGQSVEEFTVYAHMKGKWKKFSDGTTVGHKKICAQKPVEADGIKIVFEKYRKPIEITFIQAN